MLFLLLLMNTYCSYKHKARQELKLLGHKRVDLCDFVIDKTSDNLNLVQRLLINGQSHLLVLILRHLVVIQAVQVFSYGV